jgi:hypothetical protein
VRLMRFVSPLLFALVLSAASASSAFPQTTVTSVDVQRLQDSIHDASQAIGGMRDSSNASKLQAELDAAADEATYLKVKIQKNEPIGRSEYADIRDRIDNIWNRARADVDRRDPPNAGAVDDDRPVSSAGAPVRPLPPDESRDPGERTVRSQNSHEIPVGTEFDVRLQNALSSRTSQVEDRFEATTMVDLRDEGGRVMVPAGSLMRGIVSAVKGATRTDRKGSLAVTFDRVTIMGRSFPIRATVSQALESEGIMGEKGKIGIGAGAGAILGAILGGAKGALAGILIGGGGTIAATDGKDVELPSGTVLRVRMDAPLTLGR